MPEALVMKELIDSKRNRTHLFRREPSYVYYVYKNGELDPNSRTENHLRVSDYDGKTLFQKGIEVAFLGINMQSFQVECPVVVTLSDWTKLKGTAHVDLYFDIMKPRQIANLIGINGTYVHTIHQKERHTSLETDSIKTNIEGYVVDGIQISLIDHDTTADYLETIFKQFFDRLDRDVGLSSRGLKPQRVSIDFDESSQEGVNRFRSERGYDADRFRLDTEFQMKEASIRFEQRRLLIDIAREEYNLINGS